MPSSLHNSPFLALRHDDTCGRSKTTTIPSTKSPPAQKSSPFSSLANTPAATSSSHAKVNGYAHTNGHTNDHANGHANGYLDAKGTPNDEFIRLDQPQQDVLLLHGPRQRYSLERAQEIPELRAEREILIQVLAIGLNPVDWKGADYGFGQPSYPWVNGRDFAGIVVRAPKTDSKIKVGDVVCGPSTDYRDVRKAAYQEYLVTTDYNVARIPAETTVKNGASLGVAFVAAAIGLGISLGVNYAPLNGGPDLYSLIRSVDRSKIPQDVQTECLNNMTEAERPQPGEWLAIWGASSASAAFALQFAKRAGMRCICVADAAKHSSRLYDLGADIIVDRMDQERAVDIIKSVTGGKLRFALDASGKDTAQLLQRAMSPSEDGRRAHIIGLAGLPSHNARGIVHHSLAVKIFHDLPIIGEHVTEWLENLLLSKTLHLPHVEVAEGGLAGVNAALDRLRNGSVGAKRVVVPIGEVGRKQEPQYSSDVPPKTAEDEDSNHHPELAYHDKINADPDRLKFAYWVPNVSGGLVISKIPQRTYWDYKSNKRYGRIAERVGFEYALTQIRFMAGYGAENQHESVSFSQAILHATRRLKVIAALLPGPWNPAVAAKQVASIDNYSDGRIAVNVVSGWFKAEFTSIGQWWLDHAERYRRSREFIQCLKGIWTQDSFSFKGDFYQFHDYPLKPKPLDLPGRPYPEVFQGGNSHDARENGALVSDYYFMNGNTLEGFQAQIKDVKERAEKYGRKGQVKFAVNAFVIVRETEEEAIRVLQEIQGKADKDAVEGFRQQVQNAGASTSNKTGMWANSKFEDLVQYNDGFKTKLIGTKEQVVDRILLLKSLGISILLCAFLHYEEEIQTFGEEVLAEVRRQEAKGRGKDEQYEVSLTGDVYREKNNPGKTTK